jgi:glycosyltransferase involved in cell wall biosynthesis
VLDSAKAPEELGVIGLDYAPVESACQYYRIDVPLRSLAERGVATWKDEGKGDRTVALQAMLNTDILQAYGMSGDSMPGMFETIRDMQPAKTSDGRIAVPPSIVYDMDDNLDYIHPFNSVFVHMGTRDYFGQLLDPGDELETVMPDGTKQKVWVDGKTRGDDNILFDISRNRSFINSCHALAKMSHGVTVPSEILADYYKKVHGIKNVHVYPNTVIPEDYEYFDLAPRTDDTVRILWQGGSSHFIDWFPLRGAIKEVAEKYPNAKFVIWGQKFPWIHDVLPPEQVEFHEWKPYAAYKVKRTLLDIDINLCPLSNNIFNKCKSAIKWYEASLGPRPEATLASRVPPYSTEMIDGETGLLYETPEEFAQKLGVLIENADLRRRVAANAQEWVLANRTPAATTPGLLEFYQELRRQREYPYHAKLIMS